MRLHLFGAAWANVLQRHGPKTAIYGNDREILRTFVDIEAERIAWRDKLSSFPKGSTILVQLAEDAAWPAIFLATLDLSLVMVPLETEVAGQQLDNVVTVTRPHATIRSKELSRLHSDSPDWTTPQPDLLKLTSGTTGLPRAIRFRDSQLFSDCRNICNSMGLLPEDVNFGAIPFAHSYGFSNLVTPLLYQGTRFVCSRDRLPRAIYRHIEESEATVLPATPAIFQALSSLSDRDRLGAIRICISAGAPLPAETVQQFYRRYNLRIHSFYGSSECGGIMFDREGRLDAPSGFVGTPMDGVQITRLPNDRIEITGATVGDGYFPDQDSETLQTGRFRPGDLVRWLDESAQLYGRASDFINIAGKKIHPSLVEEHIRKLAGVIEVIAFGVPSPNRNEDLVALVISNPPISRQTLEAHCRAGLADWQVPRDFEIVNELPVNARGKIKRSDLASEYVARRGMS
ncbi:MAG: long-chain fatty acid--CoA ligase [Verrucomicrobia bacterium]|nr:long-chain fatty acid--CoA ligase [Verrucomicrobiota bacterium]